MIGSWGNWCECKRPGTKKVGDAIGYFSHEKAEWKGMYIIVLWRGAKKPKIVDVRELVFRGAWDPHHWKKEKYPNG